MQDILSKINLMFNTWYKSRQFVKRQNSPSKIAQIQSVKLQKLISHSYRNIKYYKELFESLNVKPDDIKTPADLQRLPFLTKDQLRNQFWDFLPRKLPSCRVSRTSGSTGIPVCILSDTNSRIANSASVIRCRKNLGLKNFRTAILTPLKQISEPNRQPHWTFLQGFHKTFYVNPYKSPDNDSIGLLEKLKSPAIIGITPAMKSLAYQIRDRLLPPVKPSAVMTTGEYLNPETRQLLETTFKTTVTDVYACNEAGDIAWQCKKGQLYHINADNCILEITKDERPAEPGETGEVVITNLNRFSMPIIRYKNGDLANLSDKACQCGCRLPVIEKIVGRTGDDIKLPDGKAVPWNLLKGFMNHPGIRQFQLVQQERGDLLIIFVPEKNLNIAPLCNLLKSRFESVLENYIKIKFRIVNSIPPAPSGKSKLVISRYNPEA